MSDGLDGQDDTNADRAEADSALAGRSDPMSATMGARHRPAEQTIATVFFSMAMVPLAVAMAKDPPRSADAWCFVGFFVLARCKIFLDDITAAIHGRDRGVLQWAVATGLGAVAWFLWICASTHFATLTVAIWWLFAAVLVTTLTLSPGTAEPDLRGWWLVFNGLYAGSLLNAALVWIGPRWASLLFACGVVVFDFIWTWLAVARTSVPHREPSRAT